MKTLLAFVAISIMGFHADRSGNLRLSLWDGNDIRSGLIVKGSPSYRWFREHVSRDSVASFGEADAMTVRMGFSNDTIVSLK